MDKVKNQPDLWPWQSFAIAAFFKGIRAFFLRYGGGKSRVVLEIAKQRSKPMRLVIICRPRNVDTWTKQVQDWIGGEQAQVYAGTKKKRLALRREWLHNMTQPLPLIIIMSYPIARVDSNLLTSDMFSGVLLVSDESTTVKNPTVTTRAVMQYSQYAESSVVLTGNPIPESPLEIWHQYEVAYPGRNPFGKSYYRFKSDWFVPSDYGWTLRHDKTDAFLDKVRLHSCLLTDEDILALNRNLPVEIHVEDYFSLTTKQKELVKELEDHWRLDQHDINYATTIYLKLQEICDGFYYNGEGIPTFLEENPKLELLLDILKQLRSEGHHKMVVWRQFTADDTILTPNIFRYAGYTPFYGPSCLAEFRDAEKPCAIILPVACAPGLNDLVVADAAIFFSNSPSGEIRAQAQSRLIRFGSGAAKVKTIDLLAREGRDSAIFEYVRSKGPI